MMFLKDGIYTDLTPAGVEFKDIYFGYIQGEILALSSDDVEYKINFSYSSISQLSNSPMTGMSTVGGRYFKKTSNSIQYFSEGTFKDIDLRALNFSDIDNVAYGTHYIVMLDKDGNVWVYGLYDSWAV